MVRPFCIPTWRIPLEKSHLYKLLEIRFYKVSVKREDQLQGPARGC